jgi:hypothetical protein
LADLASVSKAPGFVAAGLFFFIDIRSVLPHNLFHEK